jgi:hypothetical protein
MGPSSITPRANAAPEALPKIQALEEALKKAEREATEAKVRAALYVGVAVASFFLPQIGWFTKATIAFGQWRLGEALGGPKSSEFNDTVSNAGNWGQRDCRAGRHGRGAYARRIIQPTGWRSNRARRRGA